MGAKHYSQLIAWQLANELKLGIFKATACGPASHDLKFREQIRDSADSAARNIAEGFGRYEHREFARFLRIARGSLDETQNHLQDGRDKAYFAADLFASLWQLSKRAVVATTRLIIYLKRHKEPEVGNRYE